MKKHYDDAARHALITLQQVIDTAKELSALSIDLSDAAVDLERLRDVLLTYDVNTELYINTLKTVEDTNKKFQKTLKELIAGVKIYKLVDKKRR